MAAPSNEHGRAGAAVVTVVAVGRGVSGQEGLPDAPVCACAESPSQ